jgi:2-polyprenyl-3-methyl-5-hydroxy-6-metoxy-1,4-benzoquinol methylase
MTKAFGHEDYDSYWRDPHRASMRDHASRNHRRMTDLIFEHVAPKSLILDCGVGAGAYYRLLLPNYDMRGIEISKVAIDGYDFDKSGIRQGDLEEPLPDFGVQFDAAIVGMVIHHLRDPARFLTDLRSKLKPGGKLFILHPNIGYHKHRLAFLFGRFPKLSSSHRVFLMPRALRALITQTGFTVERVHGQKAKPIPELFARDLFYVCAAK